LVDELLVELGAFGLVVGGGVIALLFRVGRNWMSVWKNPQPSQIDSK
jgi:hypothetical protein